MRCQAWNAGARLLAVVIAASVAAPAVAGRLPRYGGDVRVQLAAIPSSVDPLRLHSDEGAFVASCMYEGLARWSGADLAPAIARRWLRDDEGRTWRFQLRTDVLFHDGTRCDAQAVHDALERLADPRQSAYAWLLSEVAGWSDFAAGRTQALEGLTVPAADEVELRLSSPITDLPARLALPVAGIAKRRGGDWVGTGPYQMQVVLPGEIRLVAFKDHHAGRPFLDRVELVSRPQSEKALAGDVAELARVVASDVLPAGAARRRVPAERLGMVLVHPKSVVLGAAKTRHKLAEGFDRAVFVRAVLGGDGEATEGLSPHGMKTVTARTAEPLGDLASRPQQRARILVAAGEPVLRALGERLQVHLFALGLGADLEVLPEGALQQAFEHRPWDLVVLGWTPPQPSVGALEPATRAQLLVTSALAPVLGNALPEAWATARLRGAKDPEQALLRGDLCIPLVFFHDLWQTTADLQHLQLGTAGADFGVADAHLLPHAP
jgi:MarR-like DNA-binding transcriptional regulator SgrR of sgrS sRNA